MRPNRIVFFVALALLVAACTGGTEPIPDTVDGSEPGLVDSSGDPSAPAGGDSGSDAAVVVPPLPVLSAAAEIGDPGATVGVTGDPRLDGDVFLVGPEGDLSSAHLEAGSATLSIPQGTSPGRYGLRLNDGEAWGTLTVLNSPGLAVLGAGYVRPGDAPEVEVLVHGVNAQMVAAIELQGSDGSIQRLIPHPLLGLAPVTAQSGVKGLSEGRHRLALPAGFEGAVRVVADAPDLLADPYGEETLSVVSTELRIRACDEASALTGDLGAGGVVSVMTAGAQSPSRASTGDGAFRVDVDPGWSLVSAIRMDGSIPAASPQLIKVACGAVVDLGDLETPIDTGPEPGAYLGGLTTDDLWEYTTTVTGEFSFEQEGFADCSVSGGALEVTFGASSADPWLYALTLGPPIDTGTYEGSLHLDDIFSGDSADGILSGEIEVGRIEDLDAIGGAFSGAIDGPLGSADIEVQFTCAVFSLTGGLTQPDQAGVLAVLPAGGTQATLTSQIGGGSSSGDECKKLFVYGTQPEGVEAGVDAAAEYWGAMLLPELPRLAINTADFLRALAWIEGARQLFGEVDGETMGIDLAGAVGSDYLLNLAIQPVADSWYFTAVLLDVAENRRLASLEASASSAEALGDAIVDRWSELVEPLRKAGICAEFDPETSVVDVGATQDFTVKVTDLADEPPESPEVLEFTSSCGTWQPASGAIDGDTWHTTFTAGDKACSEKVSANVKARGTVGQVEATADTSIVVEALWQFETTITFDNEHSHVIAESSGEFFVESDFDALIGAGTGSVEGNGEARCEVNGAVTWQPFTLAGGYQVMVAGEVTERPKIKAPWTAKFAPMGFGIDSQMTYHTSSDCIEAGTYSNDLLGFLGIGALVGMPHWLAYQPGGFLTYMNPTGDGVTSTETLIGLPGATIEYRLWRLQP